MSTAIARPFAFVPLSRPLPYWPSGLLGQPGALDDIGTRDLDVDETSGFRLSGTPNTGIRFARACRSGTWRHSYPWGPKVLAIRPTTGPVGGGVVLTISGADLMEHASVWIIGVPATNVTVVDHTTITVITPVSPGPGAKDVTIQDPSPAASVPGAISTLSSAYTCV